MSNEKNKKEMVDDYVDYMDIDAISDEIIDLLNISAMPQCGTV